MRPRRVLSHRSGRLFETQCIPLHTEPLHIELPVVLQAQQIVLGGLVAGFHFQSALELFDRFVSLPLLVQHERVGVVGQNLLLVGLDRRFHDLKRSV